MLEFVLAVISVVGAIYTIIAYYQSKHSSKDFILKQIEKERNLKNEAYNAIMRKYGVDSRIDRSTKEGREYIKHSEKLHYWEQRL